jgi:hypothetical protein
LFAKVNGKDVLGELTLSGLPIQKILSVLSHSSGRAFRIGKRILKTRLKSEKYL